MRIAERRETSTFRLLVQVNGFAVSLAPSPTRLPGPCRMRKTEQCFSSTVWISPLSDGGVHSNHDRFAWEVARWFIFLLAVWQEFKGVFPRACSFVRADPVARSIARGSSCFTRRSAINCFRRTSKLCSPHRLAAFGSLIPSEGSVS